MAVPNDVAGNVCSPRIIRARETLSGEMKSRLGVIFKCEYDRAYDSAFAGEHMTIGRWLGSEIALQLMQQLQRLFKAHCKSQSPRDRKPDLRLTSDHFRRQLTLPSEQGEEIAFLDQAHGAILDEAQRPVGIAPKYRVLHCVSPQLLRAIPSSRPLMQPRNFNAVLGLQPVL